MPSNRSSWPRDHSTRYRTAVITGIASELGALADARVHLPRYRVTAEISLCWTHLIPRNDIFRPSHWLRNCGFLTKNLFSFLNFRREKKRTLALFKTRRFGSEWERSKTSFPVQWHKREDEILRGKTGVPKQDFLKPANRYIILRHNEPLAYYKRIIRTS